MTNLGRCPPDWLVNSHEWNPSLALPEFVFELAVHHKEYAVAYADFELVLGVVEGGRGAGNEVEHLARGLGGQMLEKEEEDDDVKEVFHGFGLIEELEFVILMCSPKIFPPFFV